MLADANVCYTYNIQHAMYNNVVIVVVLCALLHYARQYV